MVIAGANSGIGLEIAKAALATGNKVITIGSNTDSANFKKVFGL